MRHPPWRCTQPSRRSSEARLDTSAQVAFKLTRARARAEFLKVSEIHTLHIKQFGNVNGTPVVFLHGGSFLSPPLLSSLNSLAAAGPGGGFDDRDAQRL